MIVRCGACTWQGNLAQVIEHPKTREVLCPDCMKHRIPVKVHPVYVLVKVGEFWYFHHADQLEKLDAALASFNNKAFLDATVRALKAKGAFIEVK